jgi:uncharacterized protein involved in exopolysaccharide biosynthesis
VRTPLRRSLRFKVFAVCFLLTLAAGSIWNFTRPPLYRASATVLVEAPKGIGFAAGKQGADTQNVAVQGRVLLAQPLMAQTLERAARGAAKVAGLDPEGLRAMLSVQPTPQTNLVELAAVGGDPELLAALVNAWVEVYLEERRQRTESDVDESLVQLQEEYQRLEEEKRTKRQALDDYREQNGIDTMERDGNQSLARLNALTGDLNTVRAEQLKAQAELEALEAAIARGEPVVPQTEQPGMDKLRKEAAELRAQLAVLGERYTPAYLQHEPTLKELPIQLKELEAQIAAKLADGRNFLRSELSRTAARARRQVEVQEQQLAVARSEASRFTARYARYETLKKDLEKVDELHRKLESRIVDVKAKAPQRYDQAEVVERAFPPRIPFEPPYWRDFLYTLAAAGIAALAAVLLVELLTRRTREEDEIQPMTGVRVTVPGGAASAPPQAARHTLVGSRPPAIPREEPQALPGAIGRELAPAEVAALVGLADPATRGLLGLLLGGLTMAECASLAESDFDLGQGLVRSPVDGRELALGPALVDLLAAHRPLPLWSGATGSASAEGLAGRLALLAHDAGLARPGEVDAESIRHTYICWLVRQGARLTEVERILGQLPAAELVRYGAYSPGGTARPLADLDALYPVFAARP